MKYNFARRLMHTQASFLREILKVASQPEIISFAGGLPNPAFFPNRALAEAAVTILEQDGAEALQYTTSEGYLPLREYIAQRYWLRYRLQVDPSEILITNGSQQGLDLIGKVFLDAQDGVAIESPGYLGAIQAFSVYEPRFHPVPMNEDGIDITVLAQTLAQHSIKVFYGVPNFQNPSGLTYSETRRREVAQLLKQHEVVCVEDDPYGEIRFTNQDLRPLRYWVKDQGLLLGSFSKMISPGIRLGWICAPEPIMKKLLIVKQAANLHSNYLTQRIVYHYLQHYALDQHLAKIRVAYKQQCDWMMALIAQEFPSEVSLTQPPGGMFLWLTLPETISALTLFEIARDLQVAFVPGSAFHIDGGGQNTLRLNFSNADKRQIERGIKRLAQAIAICQNNVEAGQKAYAETGVLVR